MNSEPESKSLATPELFYFLNQNDGFYKWKMEENPLQYKTMIIVGSITMCLFGLLDILYLQDPWRSEFLKITFLGIGPFLIITALIYKYDNTSWFCPLSIFLTLVVSALACVKLVNLAESAGIGPIYPVLMVIVLFSFFLSGLHYFLSMIISLTILIAYCVANFDQFCSTIGFPPEIVFLSLSILASLIGSISMERSLRKRFLQSEELSYFADRDSLTGLFNRRYFFNFAGKIWKQCLRDQLPLTIMIADVDFFKKYNDYYGHVQGDKCLLALSGTFESAMKRPFDLVSRFGGEEFIFLWFNTDSNYIEKVMEEIRRDVESLKIEHADSKINSYVTISAGLASCIPSETTSIKDLVQNADASLYKAKTQGRNRCVYQ
ncbi:diguanylate cyclase [Oceanispirochaeta sp.]|jgi:diguanylate cyclase (GGDEF)-like protein|uniref:GGDEF domain-containing protein n=1 Tax=Oceanispirochaeta sp. TaxID=2035350 RepID=UPI0026218BE5|nr:diguanylate cyclase [Oceanispirochaeta sp.]MDA3956925.1 GGDEF domain-containing protein [Oceanispirochaeta sp.]